MEIVSYRRDEQCNKKRKRQPKLNNMKQSHLRLQQTGEFKTSPTHANVDLRSSATGSQISDFESCARSVNLQNGIKARGSLTTFVNNSNGEEGSLPRGSMCFQSSKNPFQK